MSGRRTIRVWVLLGLGTLCAVACRAEQPVAPRDGRLPAGASEYIRAIRSARTAYAYRLNTAAGILECDSLEGPGAGLGCPAVVRRWAVGNASWVDSLANLLSSPEAYSGAEKSLVSYPDLALRFEGESGWVEVILDTAYRQIWMRAPRRGPAVGLYDRVRDDLCALIRGILPPDMGFDPQGVIVGPRPELATDYPNRGAPVDFDVAPECVFSVNARCPGALGRSCEGDSVCLRLWIGKDGRVHAAHPVQGDSLLVAAASVAVRDWVYRPAWRGRLAVPSWIDAWVRFAPSR